jgi:hypothetical protein
VQDFFQNYCLLRARASGRRAHILVKEYIYIREAGMKLKATIFITLVILLITSCRSIQSTVTVFHDYQSYKKEKTFFIAPVNQQEGSLEFKNFAVLISEELAKQGLLNVDSIEKANIVVIFGYSIDNGKENIDSLPIIGQTGVSSSNTYGTARINGNTIYGNTTTTYNPTYGVVGSSTYSYTTFTRIFWINLIDKESLNNGKAELIYEGKSISSGSSNSIVEVLPYLIKMVFNEFPGKNGSVRKEVMPFQW